MLPAPKRGGQAQHTFTSVSFRGLLRPDNFEAIGSTQGPCLGTKAKSCMAKKEIWFPPTSTGGSWGNYELGSIIMTLTMVEYRKRHIIQKNLSPGILFWKTATYCFWGYSQVAVFTNHQWTYLHEPVSLLFKPIYIIFSDVYNVAGPLLSPMSPPLSAEVPSFDQNGIQWPVNLSLLSSAQVVGCTCPLNEVKMTTIHSYSEVTELWQLPLVKGF